MRTLKAQFDQQQFSNGYELVNGVIMHTETECSLDEPRDFHLPDIPGYLEWSKRKLHDGESEALIAHLDATCMWLRPSQLNNISVDEFDELLDDLKTSLDFLDNESE